MKPQVRKFINENLSIDYDITLFEKGIEWLQHFWYSNEAAVSVMSRSTLFWNWWANQWQIRTEQCIYGTGFDLHETNLTKQEKEVLEEAYQDAHDIKNSCRIYPTNRMRDLMLEIKTKLNTVK